MIYGVISEGLLILILFILYTRARGQAQQVVEANEEIKLQNAAEEKKCLELYNLHTSLEEQQKAKEAELASLKIQVSAQNNLLQSFTLTNQQLEADAKERAEKSYEAAAASLTEKYTQQEAQLESEYKQKSEQLLTLIQKEEAVLEDLKGKQLAYIQAKQREEELAAKKDYYRLVLQELDQQEIKTLRNLQVQFSRKEVIDKLIWDCYYKDAYDLLMAHLFNGSEKVCGIYKITNLENGQAYIGQSVDIRERFRQHIKASLATGPTTNKLYQQMKKYLPENFTFEVLETVSKEKLNEREVYWIEFYKTKDFGMNNTKGGS